MKKFLSIMLAILFLGVFTGCASIQFAGGDETQKVVITSAARIAGYKIAIENPDLAAVALPYAQSLIAISEDTANSQDVIDKLFPAAVKALKDQIKDPIVAASVGDVLALVKLDIKDAPEVNLGKIKFALYGFVDGMKLAQK